MANTASNQDACKNQSPVLHLKTDPSGLYFDCAGGARRLAPPTVDGRSSGEETRGSMNRGELVSRERRAMWLLILLLLFAVALGLGLWIASGAAGPPTPVISPIGLPKDVTSQRSAHFRFSAARPVTFECALDAQPFTTCGANVVGSKSYPGPLSLGQHTFKVRSALGHRTSPAATYSWFILRSSGQPPSPVRSPSWLVRRRPSSGSGSGGLVARSGGPRAARDRVAARAAAARSGGGSSPGGRPATTPPPPLLLLLLLRLRASRAACRSRSPGSVERARAGSGEGDPAQARQPELGPDPRHASDGLGRPLRARRPAARARPTSSSTRRPGSRAPHR